MKKIIVISLLVLSAGIHAVTKQQIRLSIREKASALPGIEQYIEKHGINASISDSGNKTVLQYAASVGNSKVVKDLMQKYKFSSRDIQKAAMAAVEKGESGTLEFLIGHLKNEKSKRAILVSAVKASVPNKSIIDVLVKNVGIKVTASVMKAAKANNSLSREALKVLKKHHGKAKDAKKKKSKKKKDKKKADK